MTDDELPEGWTTELLAELVAPSSEKVEPQECMGVPYLSLEHIEGHTNRILGQGTGADVRSTKAIFNAGDVLYGKLRPYLNKVAIPNFDGICSTDILVFRQVEHLDAKFLMRLLSRREVVEFANHNSAGVQLPRISFKELGTLEIPLPPLAEQRRIVSAVERILEKVSAARARLERVPTTLKRFRQAVLAAACSGRLTADWKSETTTPERQNEWQDSTVSDACEVIVDCPHSTPKWTDVGRICVRTTQFRPSKLDLSTSRFVSESTFQERTKRLKPKSGDILYSREGTLGVACMVPDSVELCLGQRMMLLRARKGISAEFLMASLNSEHVLLQVRELTLGTTAPHVNVGDVKQFRIAIPPLAEQQEIVHRVSALFARADAIEAKAKSALKRVESLSQAVLAKAFRGELVPTEAELARRENREYEPACKLLERIRTSAESTPKPKRGRKVKE